MSRLVLNVGQCLPDQAGIARFLKSHFDVDVVPADTAVEAFELLGRRRYDLVLVNRKLDVDSSDGLEIIRRLKQDSHTADVPVMLVSNFPEAQENAVALGAARGFGKAEYRSPEAVQRLEAFLGAD